MILGTYQYEYFDDPDDPSRILIFDLNKDVTQFLEDQDESSDIYKIGTSSVSLYF